MEKVEYGVKCKVCGSLPLLLDVATINGTQYICRCPKCPPPLQPFTLRSKVEEARWDWKMMNETSYSQAKLDAAMKAVKFLLEMDADQGVTIPDERVIEAMQEMVTDRVFDLFGAAVATATRMLRAGVIKPPTLIARVGNAGKVPPMGGAIRPPTRSK